MKVLLQRLAEHLADRLGIKSKATTEESSTFSSEERQMAAEVAGRCLPFDEILSDVALEAEDCCGPTSCFQRVCIPGFAGVHELLLDNPSDRKEESRNQIRRARAALYATCHFVPFLRTQRTESAGNSVVCTSFFCLEALNAPEEAFENTTLDHDFLQLQSGCIEFFAACVGELFSFQSNSSSSSNEKATISLQRIYTLVKETTQTGIFAVSNPQPWATSGASTHSPTSVGSRLQLQNGQPQNTIHAVKQTIHCSVACLICLWNSLIVASQRCPEDDGKLNSMAMAILPWLTAWGSHAMHKTGGVVMPYQHPLCLTAALQLAFILVTRSKSFGALPSSADNDGASIEALHRWAFHAIEESKDANDYANVGCRVAGLKVLLAVITMNQLGGLASSIVLNSEEVGRILSLLNSLAKDDKDPKVRSLSSHILSAVVP